MSERQKIAERLRRFVRPYGPRRDGDTPKVPPNGADFEIEPRTDREYLVAIHGIVKGHTGALVGIHATQDRHDKRISALERWRVAWATAGVVGLGALGLLIQHIASIVK